MIKMTYSSDNFHEIGKSVFFSCSIDEDGDLLSYMAVKIREPENDKKYYYETEVVKVEYVGRWAQPVCAEVKILSRKEIGA